MEGHALLNTERRMLGVIQGDPAKKWTLEEILQACNWQDQAIAVTAGHGLTNKKLAKTKETSSIQIRLAKEGSNAIANGLLEARLWNWICSTDEATMQNLQQSFERHEAGSGIGLLKRLGVSLEAGKFVVADADLVNAAITKRSEFIALLPALEQSLDSELLEHFKSRRNLVESVITTSRKWNVTIAGNAVSPQQLQESEMVSEITTELLQSENWRDADYRAFDVTLQSSTPASGRSHPMQALIERIRSTFLEMGFSEIVDDYVQTAGWNMDALFIPQDHPAREMQDTFYLDNPAEIDIPQKILDAWQEIHLNGGETGSTGWGGSYSNEVSKRGLLRTHTTVNTIQYLSRNPDKACRVFAVDRVFRKEAIDKTHLPEFHQIEGIIMEEGANLQMLVTTLKTFYAKMGCPEVRVRPAYFPYTEPSLEVEVKWKGNWLELGGAGILRPEVTEPLGITTPVLAWGMGLERLAMLVLGLDDIRQLYISDLEWLRNQPIL